MVLHGSYQGRHIAHWRQRGDSAQPDFRRVRLGFDPDPEPGLREERHYGKLLLAMVLALMFGGFVIGIALAVVFGTAP